MGIKWFLNIKKWLLLMVFAVFWGGISMVWASHDQGLQKSKHPNHEDSLQSVSIAPEPSGLVLFSIGAAMVAYRIRKKGN